MVIDGLVVVVVVVVVVIVVVVVGAGAGAGFVVVNHLNQKALRQSKSLKFATYPNLILTFFVMSGLCFPS